MRRRPLGQPAHAADLTIGFPDVPTSTVGHAEDIPPTAPSTRPTALVDSWRVRLSAGCVRRTRHE
ncbi:hypothetical protein ACFQ07_11825, partial [Actinomadura adrarensis]